MGRDIGVNLTIFSMIVVDTWLVYSQATGSTELQSEFYVCLAEELIDNNIDSRPQCWRNSGEDGSDSNDESPALDSGIPYSCNRWCQVSLELDALPENMELTIPLTEV